MKIRYFAWVRERIGHAEEDINLPDGVTTGSQLMAYLKGRDEGYAAAFETPDVIRIAIDHEHADAESDITEAKEVAFFPPMTGG